MVLVIICDLTFSDIDASLKFKTFNNRLQYGRGCCYNRPCGTVPVLLDTVLVLEVSFFNVAEPKLFVPALAFKKFWRRLRLQLCNYLFAQLLNKKLGFSFFLGKNII